MMSVICCASAVQATGPGGAGGWTLSENTADQDILAAGEMGPIYPVPDILGYWTMDDETGTIDDVSSYDNDGYIAGETRALWRFDANVMDDTGYSNHGSPSGATLTNGVDGSTNGAVSFDGSDDYITVAHDHSLNLSSFTVSAWVKLDQNISMQTLLQKKPTNTLDSDSNFIIYTNTMGEIAVEIGDGAGGSQLVKAGRGLPAGAWAHMAIVFDNDNDRVDFYIDGEFVSRAPLTIEPNLNTGDLIIGKHWTEIGVQNKFLDGAVDDLAIYSTPLSPTVLKQHYLRNAQYTWGLYHFDDDYTDSSVNGRSGTNSGTSFVNDKDGVDKALFMNGFSASVNIDEGPQDLEDFTIEAWVRTAVGQQQTIVSLSGVSEWNDVMEFRIGGNGMDGRLQLMVSEPGMGEETAQGGDYIADNLWHHVAVTRSGDNVILYVDGEWDGSSFMMRRPSVNDSVDIGNLRRSGSLQGYWFAGNIDEVAIYEAAFPASTIMEHFQEGKALLEPDNSEAPSLFNEWEDLDPISRDLYARNIPEHESQEYGGAELLMHFDGDASDSSGYGRNGAISGPTLTADMYGNMNSAYSFDGFNDRIIFGDYIDGMNQMTVEAWVYIDGNPNGNDAIVGKQHAYEFGINMNRNLYARLGTGASWSATLTGNQMLDLNTWHHVSFTVDGDHMSLYLDGKFDSDYWNGNGMGDSTPSLAIGGIWESPTWVNMFDGIIDEVVIYNYALSESDLMGHALIGQVGGKWKFDGNALDSSNIGNDGTVNGATYGLDRYDNYNAAMDFDGTNDYVQMNLPSVFNDLSLNDFTISFWMNADELTNDGGGWNRLFEVVKDANNYVVFDVNEAMENRIQFVVTESGITKYVQTDYDLEEGTWYHVTATWDAIMEDLELFVDGKRQFTSGAGSSMAGSINAMTVGRRSDGSTHFDGRLDDLRIYNTILPDTEIAAISQFKVLGGYWPLEGDAMDQSSNDLNGYPNGFVNPTLDRFGNPDGAMNFDGSGVINFSSAPAITGDITIEGWIKTSMNGIIVGMSNDGSMNENIIFEVNGEYLRATFEDIDKGSWAVDGGTRLTNDRWTHVAVTKRGTSVRLFVNGQLDGESSSVSPTPDVTTMDIGDTRKGGSYQWWRFRGDIDDVAIYTSALSDEEIIGHYRASAVTRTIGSWKLDGDEKDGSGNNWDLTNNGAFWTTGYSNQPSTALDFSYNEYLDMGMNFGGMKEMTFEMLFFPRSATQYSWLVHKDYVFGVGLNTDRKIEFAIGDGGTFRPPIVSSQALQMNRWYHLAGTIDGDYLELYVDGELAAYGSVGSTMASTANQMALGATNSGMNGLDGKIDEFAIHDLVMDPLTIAQHSMARTTDIMEVDNDLLGPSVIFDGEDTSVIIEGVPKIGNWTDFTVGAWVYLTDYPKPENGYMIVERWSDDPTEASFAFWVHDMGFPILTLKNESGGEFGFYNSKPIPQYEWTYVSFYRQGDTIYISNGDHVDSHSFPHPLNEVTGPVIIGSNSDQSWFLQGRIDEVFIAEEAIPEYPRYNTSSSFIDMRSIPEADIAIVDGNVYVDVEHPDKTRLRLDLIFHPNVPRSSHIVVNLFEEFSSSGSNVTGWFDTDLTPEQTTDWSDIAGRGPGGVWELRATNFGYADAIIHDFKMNLSFADELFVTTDNVQVHKRNGNTTSDLVVDEMYNGTIGSVRLNTRIDEYSSAVEDLVVRLVHPDGTEAIIHNGSTGSLWKKWFPTDRAPVESLSIFEGKYAAGTWQLDVSNGDNDNILIETWGLEFTFPPVLSDGDVTPASGTELDEFNYTVTYTSNKDNAPTSITVNIDGSGYSMVKTDAADTDYTDGAQYYYTTSGLQKGSHYYNFTAFDGSIWAIGDIDNHSNSPVVNNVAPVIQYWNFTVSPPGVPKVLSTLGVDVKAGDIYDPDTADTPVLVYEWYLNGTIIPGETNSTLDLSAYYRGDIIKVRTFANDSEEISNVIESQIEINNTKPFVSSSSFTPTTGNITTVFTATPGTWADPDGDPEGYNYHWFKNNPLSLIVAGYNETTFRPMDWPELSKGDEIKLVLLPWDGIEGGTSRTSTVMTIQNTPPSAPSITMNDNYTVSETITATVSVVGTDIDNDSILYRYEWFKKSGENWFIQETDGPVGAQSAQLNSAFSKGQLWKVRVSSYDGEDYNWTEYEFDIINTPPVIDDVTLTDPVYVNTVVTMTRDNPHDDDSDTLTYTYSWYRNGVLVVGQTNSTLTLTNTTYTKGDNITGRVIANDGTENSTMVEGTVFISNTAPSITGATMTPTNGNVTTTFTAVPGTASDPDGDTVTYLYVWVEKFGNEQANGTGFTTLRPLDYGELEKDDEFNVIIYPYDGTDYGSSKASSFRTIQNTPPAAPGVTIAATFTKTDTILATVSQASTDADTDSITYLYEWYKKSGESWIFQENDGPTTGTSAELNTAFSKGQSWRVKVGAYDGEVYNWTESDFDIVNSAPSIDSVTITDPAYTDTTISISPNNPQDGDSDAVSYNYTWYKNGVLIAGQINSTLPGTLFDKGDDIVGNIVPYDGDEHGTGINSTTVTIDNSPPTQPSVSITPASPSTNNDLTVTLSQASTDPDGDSPIKYTYRWYVDEAPERVIENSSLTTDVLPSANTTDDETWRVDVIAYDGVDGSSIGSFQVVIGNDPPEWPGDPILVYSPPSPNSSVNITISIDTGKDATDPDGGPMNYTWKFYRNSFYQPGLDFVHTNITTVQLNFSDTSRSDNWQVEVIPIDDENSFGASKFISIPGIANSDPAITAATVTPADPDTNTMLEADTTGWSDIDGDPEFRSNNWYKWYLNGAPIPGEQGYGVYFLEADEFVKGDQVKVEVRPVDGWGGEGDSVMSPEITIINTPPVITWGTIFTPGPIDLNQQLMAMYDNGTDVDDADADGVTITYQWLLNNNPIPGATSYILQLNETAFNRSDKLKLILIPHDGEDFGTNFTTGEVIIGNTAPSITSVSIEPVNANTTHSLNLNISGWYDPDGDSPDYRIEWYVNGFYTFEGAMLQSNRFSRDDQVYARVFPKDDYDEGVSEDSSTINIENSLPYFTSNPLFSPTNVYVDNTLRVNNYVIDDPDDEPGRYTKFAWTVNDVPLLHPDNQWSLDMWSDHPTGGGPIYIGKGDVVNVTLTPWDGTGEGHKVNLTTTVKNSQPTVFWAEVQPWQDIDLYTLLTAQVNEEDRWDSDQDTITLEYQWMLNGTVIPGATSQTLQLNSSAFSKDDEISVNVTPYDGEEYGSVYTTGAITIGNTAPSITGVVIEPSPVNTTHNLTVNITGWDDPDGDAEGYRIEWYMNGFYHHEGDTFYYYDSRKGDRVYARVFPTDGYEDGNSRDTIEIQVQNSIPYFSAEPTLNNQLIRIHNSLCVQNQRLDDADGLDEPNLRTKWYVNGTYTGVGYDNNACLDLWSMKQIFGLQKGEVVTVELTPHDGEDPGEMKTLNATVINTQPTISMAGLTNEGPPAEQLKADMTLRALPQGWNDDDDDPEGYYYRWYVNGVQLVNETNETLAPGHFTKGQSVYVIITPNDGTLNGSSRQSPTKPIVNSKPSADSVVIRNAADFTGIAYVNSNLTANVSGWFDVDGDVEGYRYIWSVNDNSVQGWGESYLNLTELDPNQYPFQKWDRIAISVEPNDGEVLGASIHADIQLRNTRPTLENATLTPTSPYTDQPITATPVGFLDEDGDPKGYKYIWYKNGLPIDGLDEMENTLDTIHFIKTDRISVDIIPTDGDAIDPDGTAVRSPEITVINKPPALQSITILPGEARTMDDLSLDLVYIDADGDVLSFFYDWSNNGVQLGEMNATLGNHLFVKHDIISVNVTPFDGEENGTMLPSEGKDILNTMPEFDGIDITPEPAYTDDILTATPEGWFDADGDSAGYRFQWKKDGIDIYLQKFETLDLSLYGEKGKTISVEIFPNDGDEDGISIEDYVIIGNSIPIIQSISLNPVSPSTDEDITASPLGWLDLDGDLEQYNYQWHKNGTAIPGAISTTLTKDNFVKGDLIGIVITPKNGQTPGADYWRNVTIANTPPELNQLPTLSPAKPYKEDILTVTVSGWYDIDGDEPNYQYRWYANNVIISSANTNSLDLAEYEGETIKVEVIPDDGVDTGDLVEAIIQVESFPRISSLSFDPIAPQTGDEITVEPLGWLDTDGDLPQFDYAWYNNGTLIEGAISDTLLPDNFQKGDRIMIKATPKNGIDLGEPLWANITIVNTPAQITQEPSLSPPKPYKNETLVVNVNGWVDPDGDPAQYKYKWYEDNIPISWTGSSLDLSQYEGKTIKVEVTPWDGTDEGTSLSTQIKVQSYPRITSVSITPSVATTLDDLRAEPQGWSDADGDQPQYDYVWMVNYQAQAIPNTPTLSHNEFHKGDFVEVFVIPKNGEYRGDAYSINTIIENTPPILTNSPTIEQTTGFVTTNITVDVTDLYADVDNADHVSGIEDDYSTRYFVYRWYRNNILIPNAYDNFLDLSTGNYPVEKGDIVAVEVTATDLEDLGESLRAEIEIKNTQPLITNVTIPDVIRTDDNIVVDIDGWYDPDGELESYTIKWIDKIQGEIVGNRDRITLQGSTFLKRGDIIYVEVTPKDSDGDGVTLRSEEITVQNTPPDIKSTTPANMMPTAIFENEARTFSVNVLDEDIEDDVANFRDHIDVLRYEWFVNGVMVSSSPEPSYTYVPAYDSSPDSPWNLSVIVYDLEGTSDSYYWIQSVMDRNAPPIIMEVIPPSDDDQRITEDGAKNFTVFAQDLFDGDAIYYKWFVGDEDGRNDILIEGATTNTYTYQGVQSSEGDRFSFGKHSVIVEVDDKKSNETLTVKWIVEVTGGDVTRMTESETKTFSTDPSLYYDMDSADLRYTWYIGDDFKNKYEQPAQTGSEFAYRGMLSSERNLYSEGVHILFVKMQDINTGLVTWKTWTVEISPGAVTKMDETQTKEFCVDDEFRTGGTQYVPGQVVIWYIGDDFSNKEEIQRGSAECFNYQGAYDSDGNLFSAGDHTIFYAILEDETATNPMVWGSRGVEMQNVDAPPTFFEAWGEVIVAIIAFGGTGGGVAVGNMRKRRRQGYVASILGKIENIYEENEGEPAICEAELINLKNDLTQSTIKGKLDSESYSLLTQKTDEKLKMIRTMTLSKFGVMPADVATTFNEILEDGTITTDEFSRMKYVLQKSDLSEEKKKEIEAEVEGWMKKDTSNLSKYMTLLFEVRNLRQEDPEAGDAKLEEVKHIVEEDYRKGKIDFQNYHIIQDKFAELIGGARTDELMKDVGKVHKSVKVRVAEILEDGVVTADEVKELETFLQESDKVDETTRLKIEGLMRTYQQKDSSFLSTYIIQINEILDGGEVGEDGGEGKLQELKRQLNSDLKDNRMKFDDYLAIETKINESIKEVRQTRMGTNVGAVSDDVEAKIKEILADGVVTSTEVNQIASLMAASQMDRGQQAQITGMLSGFMQQDQDFLSTYLIEINDLQSTADQLPDGGESKLIELKSRLSQDLKSGKIKARDYLSVEERLNGALKEARERVVNSNIGEVPREVSDTIHEILDDGVITSDEFATLSALISKTEGVDDATRQKINSIFGTWMSKDQHAASDYMNVIDKAYADNRENPQGAETKLLDIKERLIEGIKRGIIDMQSYALLKERIDSHLHTLRTRMTDMLSFDSPTEVSDTIKDILDDGVVTEAEYETLKKLLARTEHMDDATRQKIETVFGQYKEADKDLVEFDMVEEDQEE